MKNRCNDYKGIIYVTQARACKNQSLHNVNENHVSNIINSKAFWLRVMYRVLEEDKQDNQPEIKRAVYYFCIWHTKIGTVSQIMISKLKKKTNQKTLDGKKLN